MMFAQEQQEMVHAIHRKYHFNHLTNFLPSLILIFFHMFGEIQLLLHTFYHREECSTKGGASDGSCASGFGVCCVCMYLKDCLCPYIYSFIYILSYMYHLFMSLLPFSCLGVRSKCQ